MDVVDVEGGDLHRPSRRLCAMIRLCSGIRPDATCPWLGRWIPKYTGRRDSVAASWSNIAFHRSGNGTDGAGPICECDLPRPSSSTGERLLNRNWGSDPDARPSPLRVVRATTVELAMRSPRTQSR